MTRKKHKKIIQEAMCGTINKNNNVYVKYKLLIETKFFFLPLLFLIYIKLSIVFI